MIEYKTMTREEAKELMPIIQAFTEGKTIEYREYDGEWKVAHTPTWSSRLFYRIKPESKYRPFKTKEECWQEMLKHQPFGWTKHKEDQTYYNWIYVENNSIDTQSFDKIYKDYTFADGTPFGIKED